MPKLSKPHERTITKILVAIRVEMQNLGTTAPAIAQLLGITLASYIRLKSLPIYKQLQLQYLTGVLAPMDNNILETYNYQRRVLNSAVPTALENLVRHAAQQVDKKLNFEASKEILDRHGMHAKVSRQGLALPEQGGIAAQEDNDAANALIKNLAKAKKESSIIASEIIPPTIEDDPITNEVQ